MEFLIQSSKSLTSASRLASISSEEFSKRAIAVMERDIHGVYARYRELYKSVFLIPHAVMSLALPDGKTLRVLMDDRIVEVPRANSFCGCTLENTEIFVVHNAAEDQRFKDNPMVKDEMHVRFYTGLPLIGSTGVAFGTICMMDTIPRQLEDTRIAMMESMAEQVVAHVESEVRFECLAESAALEGGVEEEKPLSRLNLAESEPQEGVRDIRGSRAAPIIIPLSLEVDKIFDLYSSVAEAKGVDLVSSIANDLAVQFDRDLLSMVLRKFVFNGIRYCIFGGSVKVDAWKSARHIIVSIADTGAGMEPDRVQEVLGGALSQESITGMSVCKQLLEENQAQLDVLSEKGMGTTVTITFPN